MLPAVKRSRVTAAGAVAAPDGGEDAVQAQRAMAAAAAVDAQAEAEYGEKQWWQKGILACMAPRKLA